MPSTTGAQIWYVFIRSGRHTFAMSAAAAASAATAEKERLTLPRIRSPRRSTQCCLPAYSILQILLTNAIDATKNDASRTTMLAPLRKLTLCPQPGEV